MKPINNINTTITAIKFLLEHLQFINHSRNPHIGPSFPSYAAQMTENFENDMSWLKNQFALTEAHI
jgi:hypothetical protein